MEVQVIPALIVAVIFFLTAIYMLVEAYRAMRKCESAGQWRATMGIVEESNIVQPVQPDIPEFLLLRYKYNVGAASYIGTSIDFFGVERRLRADEIGLYHKRYPKHRMVTVFFNPSHPSESVLEPHNMAEFYRSRNFAAILFCIGLAVLLISHR